MRGIPGAVDSPDVATTASPGLTSEGNNVIGAVGTSTGWVVSDLVDTDPLLGPLASNVGFGMTFLPRTGSLAIDAGQNCVVSLTCATNNPPAAVTTDQRGAMRPSGSAVDIGSIEAERRHTMVTGDLDGNGLDDLVVNFGPGIGVYAWMNNGTWQFIHPSSPALMVTGDFRGNGNDAVMFVFPGFGLWYWNNGYWENQHSLDPSDLAAGGLNGDNDDELLVNFPGAGLWVRNDGAPWTNIHSFDIKAMVTGDLDISGGQDDVIIDFGPGIGLWVRMNSASWVQLHSLSPSS